MERALDLKISAARRGSQIWLVLEVLISWKVGKESSEEFERKEGRSLKERWQKGRVQRCRKKEIKEMKKAERDIFDLFQKTKNRPKFFSKILIFAQKNSIISDWKT